MVLQEGTHKALVSLRERSREIYQPEAQRLEEEALTEVRLLQPDEPYAREVEEQLKLFRERLRRAVSWFVGAPSRLLRNAETVARISSTREEKGRGERRIPEGHGLIAPSEEGLTPTDPPIECPVCGEVLFIDKEMTMLVCPVCGAREALEGDVPL